MKKQRTFWGMIFLLMAALVIISRFLPLQAITYRRIVFTVILAAWLLSSLVHRRMSGILFATAFLLILYDDLFPIAPLNPASLLLAAALGSIGFHLLAPRSEMTQKKYEQPGESFSDDCIYLKTTMGSSVKYVNSPDFKEACIECTMGSMKIYFDNAHVSGDEAKIWISAMMSDLELYIPREWEVKNSCTQTLSVIHDTETSSATCKTIMLEGNSSFSRIRICYI